MSFSRRSANESSRPAKRAISPSQTAISSGRRAGVAIWTGRPATPTKGLEAAVRTGSDSLQSMALGFAALPPAYAGDVALATSRAAECLALASRTGRVLSTRWANWAIALVALSQDDPRAAPTQPWDPCRPSSSSRACRSRFAFFLPDEIQALIALGRYERAERLLAVFEEAALRLERRWALMLADRSRALLLAARGDLDGGRRQPAKRSNDAMA